MNGPVALVIEYPCPWGPLSMGALLGNLGEDWYARGLCVEEGSGMGVSPYRGPIGGPGEGGQSVGNCERRMKGAVGMAHSLWRGSLWRTTREGSFTGYPGLWKEGAGDGRLSSWCSVGQPGVGSSTWDFERWLKGALEVGNFCGSSVKGTWREGSLAGDPRG